MSGHLNKQVGQPTKFKPAYIETIKNQMAQGYTFAAAAASFGVCRMTLYNWREQFAEFDRAVREGEILRQRFWEDLNIRQAKTGEGSSSSVIWSMKNLGSPDWRDRQEHEIGGLTVTVNAVPADKLRGEIE
jgi:hypothetical protein